MTQGTSDSGTSSLKGSYRFPSLVKISLLNSYLFQSSDPVSKIEDTTYRDCRSDLINSKNATEYV